MMRLYLTLLFCSFCFMAQSVSAERLDTIPGGAPLSDSLIVTTTPLDPGTNTATFWSFDSITPQLFERIYRPLRLDSNGKDILRSVLTSVDSERYLKHMELQLSIQDTINSRQQQVLMNATSGRLPEQEPATIVLLGAAGIALLTGGLLGWLLGRRSSASTLASTAHDAFERGKRSAEKAEAASTTTRVPTAATPAIKLETMPPLPPSTTPGIAGLLDHWEQLNREFRARLRQPTDDRTEVHTVLHEILHGRENAYAGFEKLLSDWRTQQDGRGPDPVTARADVLRRQYLNQLTTLHRMNGLTELGPTNDYLEKQGVDTAAVRDYAAGVFAVLGAELELWFERPVFGAAYDDHRYDLVAGNVGSVATIDGGDLLRTLEEMNPDHNRIIVDVGRLGLVAAADGTFVETNAVPAKTSVAYYAKTGA